MTGYVTVRRFPTLTVQTPRLDVRPLTLADADPVAQIFADKQTQRWLPFPQEFGPIEGKAWCTEMAAERRDSAVCSQGGHDRAVELHEGSSPEIWFVPGCENRWAAVLVLIHTAPT